MTAAPPPAEARPGFLAAARAGWRIGAPFFHESGWRARLLLAGVVASDLAVVVINVIYSYWNAAFFNALSAKDWDRFLWLLFVFYAAYVAPWVIRQYVNVTLQKRLIIHWRHWMTERYLAAWLDDGAHFTVRVSGFGGDNPDQRIAEDVRLFIEQFLQTGLALLSTLVGLISFSAILWRLSATPLTLFGFTVAIPGVLVVAAFAYATLGMWIMNRICRVMIGLDFTQQQAEANFRFDLAHIRETGDEIALARGEAAERVIARRLFGGIVSNWYELLRAERRYSTVYAIYAQAMYGFPYILASPLYFAGRLPLGGLTQIASAFTTIKNDFSFFANRYPWLALWTSVINRLSGFEQALARLEGQTGETIALCERDQHALVIRDVTLARPDGRPILTVPTLTLSAGERIVVQGPSGIGKTTLVRAIAGRWSFGTGSITRPAGQRILALSSRGYLPMGSLSESLAYPQPAAAVDLDTLGGALDDVGLGPFRDRLHDTVDWATTLSTGERQRIALARVFVHRPDLLLLDEATAALDVRSERELLTLVRRRLPRTSMLWVTHRRPHPDTYDRCVELTRLDARLAERSTSGTVVAAQRG